MTDDRFLKDIHEVLNQKQIGQKDIEALSACKPGLPIESSGYYFTLGQLYTLWMAQDHKIEKFREEMADLRPSLIYYKNKFQKLEKENKTLRECVKFYSSGGGGSKEDLEVFMYDHCPSGQQVDYFKKAGKRARECLAELKKDEK